MAVAGCRADGMYQRWSAPGVEWQPRGSAPLAREIGSGEGEWSLRAVGLFYYEVAEEGDAYGFVEAGEERGSLHEHLVADG